MAGVGVETVVETDMITDAVQDLASIQRALATRHGEAFRLLERRIAGLLGDTLSPPRIHILAGGIFVAQPSPEVTAIIRDARALGIS